MNGMIVTDPAPADPCTTPHAPLPGYVNLIFRGVFLFVERPGFIEVLLPNMSAEHTYRAGLFMAEVILSAADMSYPYVLTGVKAGKAGFPRDVNPVLKGFNYRPGLTQDEVYARLVLPLPYEILSLRSTKDQVQASDPTGLVNGQKFPGIHVLRYQSDDLNCVKLNGHTLPEAPGNHQMTNCAGHTGDFINLHIINEPETPAFDMAHPSHAFDCTIGLIQGLQGSIHLDPLSSTVLVPATGDYSAKGFGLIEMAQYCTCRTHHLQAGRAWRLNHCFLPDSSGFIDRPPNDCLSLIIGN